MEKHGYMVVDGRGGAERGGRDQRPVVHEVLAQQPHAVPGPAEDVARPDRHGLQVQSPQAQPDSPAGMIARRVRPGASASMTAADSRPSGPGRSRICW